MVMMAEGAALSRAAQKMVMAGLVHERKTDKEFATLLAKLEEEGSGEGNFDEAQAAVIREAKRKYATAALASARALRSSARKVEHIVCCAWCRTL
jgi:Zn-dependent M32 family carboxypeptidase